MAHCVVPLGQTHDVRSFDCGNPALNNWLQAIARQHQDKLLSRTFVLVDDDQPEEIVGFYALAPRGLVEKEMMPPELVKRLPSSLPGYTLARFAIASGSAGRGHGGLLLVDAMLRAKQVSEKVGGPFLFVDAKDQSAADFYVHYGFAPLPSDPLTLVIALKTIGFAEDA